MRRILIAILILFTISVYGSTPYVILISFDGFRWDYPNRGITPNIEKMINAGASALSLRPSFPSKTFPNHYSIVTGLYPENHGIISNIFQDPFTGETYRLGDNESVREPQWYRGEAFWETARRSGILTASYFWPGSELTIEYRRPNYVEYYNHNKPYRERIDGVIEWLSLPHAERPHFITIYFHDTDSYGHNYGPNSPEIDQSISRLDSLIGYFYDRTESIGLKDSINFILVSDHGMTEISKDRSINIEKLMDGHDVKYSNDGPFMFIDPQKHSADSLYLFLKSKAENFRVYTKFNIPDFYHFNKHPFIPDLILIAEPGWSLETNKTFERKNKKEKYSAGNHGYEKDFIDMHGVFIADGPAFKNDFRSGTVWNVDIYPLLCKIFGIAVPNNIDGKLERIEFLLKEN